MSIGCYCECLHQSASNQLTPKEMEVCTICGAFLVVGDIPQRVEEHVSGKQHMGYAKVRDTIDSLKVIYATFVIGYPLTDAFITIKGICSFHCHSE